jgi:signal transduction histidine kinase
MIGVNMLKKLFKRNSIQFKVIGVYLIMALLVCCFFYPLLPLILNYPPNLINTQFEWELEKTLYAIQFSLMFIFITLMYIIITFSKLSFLYKLDDALKNNDEHTLNFIREKLFHIPNQLLLLEILVPSLVAPVLYAISTRLIDIASLKLFVVLATFITIIATLSTTYVQNLFKKILLKINTPISAFKYRTPIAYRLYYQIIPSLIVALLLVSLVGYSSIIRETAVTNFELYLTKLDNMLITHVINSEESLFDALKSITFISSGKDKAFVIKPDGLYYNSDNEIEQYSKFWVKYINEYARKDNSIVYDYFGVDTRGVIKSITFNNQEYIIGVQYDISSSSSLLFFGMSIILLISLNIFAISLFSKTLANDVSTVSSGLSHIADKTNVDAFQKFPVTSNDEIGELVIAFNKVQDLTKENILEIKNNQQNLMEKERLASLGILIGGIAHNMKTPIMSISGAAEGLTELISEYIASLNNSSVTPEDHKEIAMDMLSWVTKIKTHASYMSDIISTVKGQAANLNTAEDEPFTVYDLLNKVDILIKHELKKASLTLNKDIKVNPDLYIQGNINNLIQVINNLIQNAIQSYNSVPGGVIDLIITQVGENINFRIKDNGCGIPREIQNKLFKEMITTKGKLGSGLGLYLSYSTIRGNFGGTMTFNSEPGVGTSFDLTIPIQ